MGLVYVTAHSDLGPDEIESVEPLAQIQHGATYFFLYPAILALRERTGQLIDPQVNAFFAETALDHLEAFLSTSQALASGQPVTWRQRVGTLTATGEPMYQTASRAEVLRFLADVTAALQHARARRMGVMFWGQ